MPTAFENEVELNDALARAVAWRRLSQGFYPPRDGALELLADIADGEALPVAIQRIGLTPFDPDRKPSSVRFEELFGHTVRAAVCVYETEYGTGRVFRQTRELSDLQGWYSAFGLVRDERVPERSDHLGVECEFAGFLCLKEARILQLRNLDEQLAIVRQAYRRFLRDHLVQFGIAVSVSIERADRTGFYGSLGRLCRELLVVECERLDLEPGPRALPMRDETEDNVQAACGADGECAEPECDGSSLLGRVSKRRLLSIGDEG